jgi:hypothetical protein
MKWKNLEIRDKWTMVLMVYGRCHQEDKVMNAPTKGNMGCF